MYNISNANILQCLYVSVRKCSIAEKLFSELADARFGAFHGDLVKDTDESIIMIY